MDTYFIGYDAREHEAAAVCVYSIRKHSKKRVKIYLLEHRLLRRLGLYNRAYTMTSDGTMVDSRDKRPFSTDFSFSRFLVFHLANVLRINSPCMFVDCDFVFLQNPGSLMMQQKKHPGSIGVVSRVRDIQEGTKMDGVPQVNYDRKLWSALFTFMPGAKLANWMNPNVVNSKRGRFLHAFAYIPSDSFWEIDPAWHYIPSLDALPVDKAKAIHYSEFSPWLNPEREAEFPKSFFLWEQYHGALLRAAVDQGELIMADNLGADMVGIR